LKLNKRARLSNEMQSIDHHINLEGTSIKEMKLRQIIITR